MRLDKYLKVSRLIKRRTVANAACEGEKVTVNGVVKKPAYKVSCGDVIAIEFRGTVTTYRVMSIEEPRGKAGAGDMIQLISVERPSEKGGAGS